MLCQKRKVAKSIRLFLKISPFVKKNLHSIFIIVVDNERAVYRWFWRATLSDTGLFLKNCCTGEIRSVTGKVFKTFEIAHVGLLSIYFRGNIVFITKRAFNHRVSLSIILHNSNCSWLMKTIVNSLFCFPASEAVWDSLRPPMKIVSIYISMRNLT